MKKKSGECEWRNVLTNGPEELFVFWSCPLSLSLSPLILGRAHTHAHAHSRPAHTKADSHTQTHTHPGRHTQPGRLTHTHSLTHHLVGLSFHNYAQKIKYKHWMFSFTRFRVRADIFERNGKLPRFCFRRLCFGFTKGTMLTASIE